MNRLADFVIMYEDNIRVAIDDAKSDFRTQRTGGGSSNHAFVSDPTAQRAIRNLTSLKAVVVQYGPRLYGKRNIKTIRNPDKILRCVEETWKFFEGKPAGTVMKLRYKKKYTNMFYVAKVMNISTQRAYVLLDNVHRHLLSLADGVGATEYKSREVARVESIMEKINHVEGKKSEEEIFTN